MARSPDSASPQRGTTCPRHLSRGGLWATHTVRPTHNVPSWVGGHSSSTRAQTPLACLCVCTEHLHSLGFQPNLSLSQAEASGVTEMSRLSEVPSHLVRRGRGELNRTGCTRPACAALRLGDGPPVLSQLGMTASRRVEKTSAVCGQHPIHPPTSCRDVAPVLTASSSPGSRSQSWPRLQQARFPPSHIPTAAAGCPGPLSLWNRTPLPPGPVSCPPPDIM